MRLPYELTKPPFADFDILYEISHQAYEGGLTKCLSSLCLVSHGAQIAATPWLYRSVKLDWSRDPRLARRLFNLLQSYQYQRYPRQIAVHCHFEQASETSADTQSWVNGIEKLLLVLPNLETFSWSGPDLMPTSLCSTLQKHPRQPEIIQALKVEFVVSRTKPLAALYKRIKQLECARAKSTVKHLALSNYTFPAQLGGLQLYLDFSRLTTLELQDCPDIGYLFNVLLSDIPNCRIRDLKVDQEGLESNRQGYFGLEKFETFLLSHAGLDTLALRGVRQEINPHVIAAQGRTLSRLTLQGSKAPRKGGICTSFPPPLLSLEETLELCAALPKLQHLQIDATCDDLFFSCAARSLRLLRNLKHLAICLFPCGSRLDQDDIMEIWNTAASRSLQMLEVWSSESLNFANPKTNDPRFPKCCHWRVEREHDGLSVINRTG